MFASTTTPDQIRTRQMLKKEGMDLPKMIRVYRERGRPSNRMRMYMAKQHVNPEYLENLQAFCAKLGADQAKGLIERGEDGKYAAVTAFYETGRKFDKVSIVYHLKHGKPRVEVRYFVDRNEGTIYGAKTKLGPNFNWKFGTVDTFREWNWSEFHGVPKGLNKEGVSERAGVKVVGGYGDFTHYGPLDE